MKRPSWGMGVTIILLQVPSKKKKNKQKAFIYFTLLVGREFYFHHAHFSAGFIPSMLTFPVPFCYYILISWYPIPSSFTFLISAFILVSL